MNTVQPDVTSFGPPVLLAGLEGKRRLDRAQHLAVHGEPPRLRASELAELAERIDLRGRGGAGFPLARKLRAVMKAADAVEGRCAVIVNGTEGEPSCLKDTALLLYAPHLVLDGLELAVEALDAEEGVIGVTREDTEKSLTDALAERGAAAQDVLRIQRLPERFVTGEGTALTNGLNDRLAVPAGQKVRTSERGLRGLPTLLSNTETFAQLAIAARRGATAYCETGLSTEPGTVLLTVSGSWVVETPTGAPLSYILEMCGATPGQGVLVGGYHGKWISAEAARSVTVSRAALSAVGGALGAGAVIPLPESTCPLGETARVARWMAEESANQCGPCVWGLNGLAEQMTALAGRGGRPAYDAVFQYMDGVRGRGACSHPDGTSGFVTSALSAFSADVSQHVYEGGCGRPVAGVLPLNEDVDLRLLVDWTLCRAHGLCADVLPTVIKLGLDGYPDSANMPVKAELREQALRAVRRCPALALRIDS
ncbi:MULTISPECIES: NADH-ubiquinone oxidoreductase-F iron-sulfur binding region domain-containing protein [unclassified Streptomyces]|uniref:Ferredoxin n=1 Tax=Streptomyces sp. NBC_00060 TaxID=2975636 RepID=A0AAU2GRD1_9ACTN